MSIFKRIFGGGNKNETKTTNKDKPLTQEQLKVKRTIFDFFQLDLINIPDDSFVEADVETNVVGSTVQTFYKTLDYKECDIFDEVQVYVIDGKSKNIILKSFQPESVKMDNLKKLIDELYRIYGNDWDNRGKFINKDIELYRDTVFYALFGRIWTDNPKYKNEVLIGRDEDEISITIRDVEMA